MRRDQDGGGPLEAIAEILAAVSRGVERVNADVAGLARAVVVARDDAAVFTSENNVRIRRIVRGVARLAAANFVPVAIADALGDEAVAGSPRRAEVLHGAGNVIGRVVIDGNMIELSDRQRRR